jgi:hypothetical protein
MWLTKVTGLTAFLYPVTELWLTKAKCKTGRSYSGYEADNDDLYDSLFSFMFSIRLFTQSYGRMEIILPAAAALNADGVNSRRLNNRVSICGNCTNFMTDKTNLINEEDTCPFGDADSLPGIMVTASQY